MARSSVWRVMVQFTSANLTGAGFGSLINSVNQAHQSTTNLTAAMSALKIAGGEAMMSIGKSAIDAFGQAVTEAGKFQMTMTLLKQSMGDPNAYSGGPRQYLRDLQALNAQRQDLMLGNNPVLFGTQELTDVQKALLQSGFTTQQITQKTNGHSVGQAVTYIAEMEQLRKIGPGSAQGSAENVSKFLAAYGVSGEEAYKTADTLARIQAVVPHFDSSAVKQYEQFFGLMARTMHVSAPDMLLLAGFMSRMGNQPSTGATSLNNLLLQSLNPTKGLTNFESSQRLRAAVDLGILGPIDVDQAKKRYRQYNSELASLGIAEDPSRRTAAQIEKLAKSTAVSTMPNLMLDALRKGGAEGLINWMGQSRQRMENLAVQRGQTSYQGDLDFTRDMSALLNLRGGRAAFALGAKGDAGLKYLSDVRREQPIDKLIAEARNTLGGQEATASSRFNAILLSLGGVDLATGNPIAGGPLDTVIKLLKALNGFMGEIMKFNAAHPDAAGRIGMAVGALGVVLTALGAIITGAGAFGLLRLGLGGAAGMGAVGGALRVGAGGMLSSVGRGLAGPIPWLLGALGGALGFGGAHAAPNFMQRGMSWMGGAMGFGGAHMAGAGGIMGLATSFLEVLARVALRFANIVGWATLVIDTLHAIANNPKAIADIFAMIFKFMRDTFAPGVVNIFLWIFKFIGSELGKAWEMIRNIFTNPATIGKWFSDFKTQWDKDMASSAPSMPGGGKNITVVQTNNIHGMKPGDAKKVADHHTAGLVAMSRRAQWVSTGGNGAPGSPSAAGGAR